MSRPDLDVSCVIATRDDDDRIGHTARRVALHLRALALRFEILIVDEGSGDNTLPLLGLLRREVPELEVIAGADPGRGFVRGAGLARGRALVLLDARREASLAALGFALQRVATSHDAVVIGGRYLVLHRTRTFRAHDALAGRRDPDELGHRLLRRARALGLRVDLAAARPAPSVWSRLRTALRSPLASRI